jgi:hypothetical protein
MSKPIADQIALAAARVRISGVIIPPAQESDMHPMMAEEVLKTCRQRSAEGDAPSVKAHTVETLEGAVIELAQQRDKLRSVLADWVDAVASHTSLAEERERTPIIEAAARALLENTPEQQSLCQVCNVLILSDEIRCGHEGCPLR